MEIMPRPDAKRFMWVSQLIRKIPRGQSILDVGCGPQIYRHVCTHLNYKAQDFGLYTGEGAEGIHDGKSWTYGDLDFKGDCWDIDTPNESFDNIICTEVLEHIPFARETVLEIGRILKKGGTAIITAPVNCLPHQNPYFFSHGYSKEFYLESAKAAGLEVVSFELNSGAMDFMFLETYRLFRAGYWLLLFCLIPLMAYRLLGIKGPDYPTFGAHVVMRKLK